MKKLFIILLFSLSFTLHAQEYALVSLYEQLVFNTETSTVTVSQDTMLSVPVTVAVALSLTLKGGKEGITITGTGYTEDGFTYPSMILE